MSAPGPEMVEADAGQVVLGVIGHDYLDHGPEPESDGGEAPDFRTIRIVVPGATPERILLADPTLAEGYVEVARELERRGARAITADCGLAVQFQTAVADAVSVPAALSTLLLAPAILGMLPAERRLGIIVGDKEHFGADHHRWSGIDPADERVVIHGMDGTRTMRAWNTPEHTTDWGVVAEEASACGADLLADHPEVSHVLLECTGLPPVAERLRAETGLPIVDWNTLCRTLATSVVA